MGTYKRKKLSKKKCSRHIFMLVIGMLLGLLVYGDAFAASSSKQMEQANISLLQCGDLLEESKYSSDEALLTVSDQQYQLAEELITKALDNFEESCDLTECNIQSSDFSSSGILSNVLNHNPRYFYVSGGCSWYINSDGTVAEVIFQYKDLDNPKEMVAAYDEEVRKVVEGADSGWSDLEKALYINDYLCRYCEYDTEFENSNMYSAYGALVDKKAVCNGYSLAFMELAKQLDLTCEFVTSSSLNHAWNIVKVNGKYYYIDSTWNDPIDDLIGRARHIYFLKSYDYYIDQESSDYSTHLVEDDWVLTGDLECDIAVDGKYDDYFWNQTKVGFNYSNGYWYGVEKGSESNSINICKFSCDGTDITSVETLSSVSASWPVWDKAGYTWVGNYSGFGCFDNTVYYTDKINIYSYDLVNNKLDTYYTLSEEEQSLGYLYGLNVDYYGTIQYLISTSPSDTTTGTINNLARTCNITYELNGGTNHADNPAQFDNVTDFELKAPTKENYTFDGWYLDAEFKNAITKLVAGQCKNVTLYAKWIETEHVFGEWEEYQAPTCCAVGESRRYCELCGAYESKELPTGDHSFGEWYERTAATCLAEGVEQRDCKTEGCDAFETRAIPVADHTYGEWYVDVEPNCTQPGIEKRNCEFCDNYESRDIEPLGHDFQLTEAKEATYREKGHEEGMACSRCGITEGDTEWEPELKFSILFDGNGATSGNMEAQTELSYLDGGHISPVGFECGNAQFVGWNSKADGTGIAFSDEDDIRKLIDLVEENQGTVTLYAQWKRVQCNIIYELDGGVNASGNRDCYLLSELPVTLEAPVKAGYIFDGWYMDPDYTEEITSITDVESDLTLYAKWIAKKYQIQFDGNGSTSGEMAVQTDLLFSDDSKLQANVFKRVGYYFTGWNSKPDGSGISFGNEALVSAVIQQVEASGDNNVITLYASWKLYSYKLTYNLNGGTNNVDNPATYTYTTDTFVLRYPKKRGYTFGGWYTDAGFKNKITQITKGSVGSKTLYAKWTPTKYKITYVLNGGTNNKLNPATYTVATTTFSYKTPTRKGYTFMGWYTDSACTKRTYQVKKGTIGNKTLYAKWSLTKYKITYKLNGGTNNSANPASYTIYTSTITLKYPRRSGYKFGGWYTDSACTKRTYQIKKGSTGNRTLYAKWIKV